MASVSLTGLGDLHHIRETGRQCPVGPLPRRVLCPRSHGVRKEGERIGGRDQKEIPWVTKANGSKRHPGFQRK